MEAMAEAAGAPREDHRVRCTSRRAVARALELCGRFVRELGEALPAGVRELATFEAAVQENVSIGGRAWQEASEWAGSQEVLRTDSWLCAQESLLVGLRITWLPDSDIKVLEDQFDEIIVDIATKRKQYPRKILECVIKIIKAKRELLKLYCPVVHPLDLTSEPDLASRVADLEHRGEVIAKEIGEAMKSLPVLIKQGEGFSQVLTMQPVIHLQKVHQEVFSGCSPSVTTQLEATPPEAFARRPSNLALPRKRPAGSPQRRCYPLRRKQIPLDT
ncbi:kinetochore-associated protein NSL1 homolog isoform X2 [Sorex araneus]|uniref:kinetochore-associated protein NSL1 homolog isoform X2 n=1 Tax=Sorex araneus TaxID=42254 RepID=UPI002433D3C8|nr:kinetochore-associated protein NSL1 homolog isoform X2 [Sorex araneus]